MYALLSNIHIFLVCRLLLVTLFNYFNLADPCYVAFHDEEWGVPVHDDKYSLSTLTFFLIS